MTIPFDEKLHPRIMQKPHFPFGLIRIGYNSIEIDKPSIQAILEGKQDEFMSDLADAARVMDEVANGVSCFPLRKELMVSHSILWGTVTLEENKPRRLNDYDAHHITIVTRNLQTQQETGLNHYISIERHNEILQQAKDSVWTEIHSEISKGVQNGIEKASKGVAKTLTDIEHERQTLKKQLKVLEKQKAQIEAREQAKANRKPRSLAGYVYVLRSDAGYYKIGRTSNPDDRLKTFNVKLPFHVEYTLLIPADDMYALESELHYQYAHKRVNGEWFNLDNSDLELLALLKPETAE